MSHQPPARAFVTGALGFIGSAVAARLRAEGAEVRGVDLRGARATVRFALSASPGSRWGTAARAAPPSYGPH